MMPLIPSTHSHNLQGFQGFSAIIMSSESNAVQAVTPCRPQQRCQKADQSLRLRLEENCGSVHLCSPLSSKTFKDLGDRCGQWISSAFHVLLQSDISSIPSITACAFSGAHVGAFCSRASECTCYAGQSGRCSVRSR